MAWEAPVLSVGNFQALIDMSSSGQETSTVHGQYRIVRSTDSQGCRTQVASSGIAIGVLQNAPSSGEAAAVMLLGVTKVWVTTTAAAVAVSDALTCTTDSAVMPLSAAVQVGIGIALEACSSGPQLISMLLTPGASGSTVNVVI